MDNHFTITIHDDNGVKQIHLHQFVKKAILYAVAFIMFLTLVAVSTILYLDYSVDAIQDKKEGVERAYEKLKLKNKKINEDMNNTKKLLLGKKRELDELSDSLDAIQIMIGMNPSADDATIQEKVDLTKLTSENMVALLQLVPNGSPIEYNGVTSKYGYRIHPTLNRREFHRGSDLKAKMNTPVYAPADGIVEFSGLHKASGFGNLVIINHSLGFKTYYGHLNKVVVKSKQFVQKGDLIAYTGNSGMSNGPHLHYEIRYLYSTLNPFFFIKWTIENYNEIFQKEKQVPWQSLVTATANLRVIKPTQTLLLSLKAQE